VAAWSQLEREEPEFAARVMALLNAHVHKTIATLRRDGSPRISGIECFFSDGDLWVGSMPGAVKARDLRRDPRYALHSGSADPPDWTSDAKLSGRAEEIRDRERRARIFGAQGPEVSGESHLFRLDLLEVVITGLNAARDRLVIELWKPGAGVRMTERT
jgi:pyridoxamine 5'-phosphate oxidase-like protein